LSPFAQTVAPLLSLSLPFGPYPPPPPPPPRLPPPNWALAKGIAVAFGLVEDVERGRAVRGRDSLAAACPGGGTPAEAARPRRRGRAWSRFPLKTRVSSSPSRRGDLGHRSTAEREGTVAREKEVPEQLRAQQQAAPPHPPGAKKKLETAGSFSAAEGKKTDSSRCSSPCFDVAPISPSPVFLTVGAADERQQREARAALVHDDWIKLD